MANKINEFLDEDLNSLCEEFESFISLFMDTYLFTKEHKNDIAAMYINKHSKEKKKNS